MKQQNKPKGRKQGGRRRFQGSASSIIADVLCLGLQAVWSQQEAMSAVENVQNLVQSLYLLAVYIFLEEAVFCVIFIFDFSSSEVARTLSYSQTVHHVRFMSHR